jgi:hypothetical protein
LEKLKFKEEVEEEELSIHNNEHSHFSIGSCGAYLMGVSMESSNKRAELSDDCLLEITLLLFLLEFLSELFFIPELASISSLLFFLSSYEKEIIEKRNKKK